MVEIDIEHYFFFPERGGGNRRLHFPSPPLVSAAAETLRYMSPHTVIVRCRSTAKQIAANITLRNDHARIRNDNAQVFRRPYNPYYYYYAPVITKTITKTKTTTS